MSSFMDVKRDGKRNAPVGQTSGIDPVTKETQVKVDGFGQVIALLEVADASFRESLINRIAAKDPHLARQIRARLAGN